MGIRKYFILLVTFGWTFFCIASENIKPEDYDKVPKPESTLKYVIVIYRHGTRAPLYFPYRTDPYKPEKKYFPEGKGRLTKVGKELMYNVGRAMRARYGEFIGDNGNFDGSKVRFTSTEGSRNKISALLVTEGMYSTGLEYPDFSDEKSIKRHKIPIRYNTNNFDKSYLVSKFPLHALECSYFSEQFVFNIISGLILPETKENLQLMKYLGEKTGNSFKSIVSFLNIWDRLECQRLNGLELPEWTKEVYPDKMRPLALNNVRQTIAGTELMNNLASALLFKEIHRHFNLITNVQPDEKIYLHATHENALYQVLFKLKIQHPTKVEVGDAMIFELHEIEAEYHVKNYYYKPFYNTLHELEIPGCEESCTLEKFIELTPEMSQETWKHLCKTESTSFLTLQKSTDNLLRFSRELAKWIRYSRS